MTQAVCLEPENGRYRADLVFLHGLWTGPDIWEPAALGLAHRGWRCHLLDLRAGGDVDSLEQWCQRTAEFMANLERPPVLIGHDAGALVALLLLMASLTHCLWINL